MRLWSLHPGYLDTKGLIAQWREGLLAQKVLLGKTRGYKNHPQLIRFKKTKDPIGMLGHYLMEIAKEAKKRRYDFKKILKPNSKIKEKIPVTKGQVEYELKLLKRKLQKRDREKCQEFNNHTRIRVNRIFKKSRATLKHRKRFLRLIIVVRWLCL